MNYLVNALILLTSLRLSLGREVESSHDPGMVYEFDNVSLGPCRDTSFNDFKLSD